MRVELKILRCKVSVNGAGVNGVTLKSGMPKGLKLYYVGHGAVAIKDGQLYIPNSNITGCQAIPGHDWLGGVSLPKDATPEVEAQKTAVVAAAREAVKSKVFKKEVSKPSRAKAKKSK